MGKTTLPPRARKRRDRRLSHVAKRPRPTLSGAAPSARAPANGVNAEAERIESTNHSEEPGSSFDYTPLRSEIPSDVDGEMRPFVSCNALTLPVDFACKRDTRTLVGKVPLPCSPVYPAGFPLNWLEKPSDSMKQHMHSLYITATFDGTVVSRVLVDNGAIINVLHLSRFKMLGYKPHDLVKTNVVVSGFNGRKSECLGVFSVHLEVGR
ncbi:hypothetical protein MLD38_025505 [Melastoma candidum]|uniref:Uncharacterized protein n=1 Tax=Melastoma candidum TaxID=119954 RepID=A0ACB9NWI5_9MYRT|nr:hypothetical protein MLD38_025505 [Melastoma candidum]